MTREVCSTLLLTCTRQFQVESPAAEKHFIKRIVDVVMSDLASSVSFYVELYDSPHEFFSALTKFSIGAVTNI